MARATMVVGLIVMLLGVVGPAKADPTIVQSWAPGTFPGGIAYDADRDHIWLVNNSTGELREYTRDGTLIQTFDGSQFGLTWLIGIDWCPTTMNLWICDEYNPEQVAEVTREGVFVSGFSVDAYMMDAVGLTYCTTDGNLYISDDDAHEVVVFATDGTYLGRWSTLPCSDADAICHVEATNTLWVGDDNAAKIYEFALDGTLIATYDLVALLGITGVDGLTVDQVAQTLFIGDSTSPYMVYEVAGMWGPVAVQETSWGRVKALFR
jgi:uncharacterized protein YjiK